MEKVIESEHINYVKVNVDLVNDYLTMINDESVRTNISHNPKTYTREEEIVWVNNVLLSRRLCFSMIEKETNKFIGNIEIRDIKNNKGELGISITPTMQNKHYGTEAVQRLTQYAFNDLDLNKIYLKAFKNNTRAIKCYQNAGFVINETSEIEVEMSIVRK